jgi:hypothetical protein
MTDFTCSTCGYKILGARGETTWCQGCGKEVSIPAQGLNGARIAMWILLAVIGFVLLVLLLLGSAGRPTRTFQTVGPSRGSSKLVP